MKNPSFIIHGLHKHNGIQFADFEIIIPRENGETRLRGSAQIGQKVEIEIIESDTLPK